MSPNALLCDESSIRCSRERLSMIACTHLDIENMEDKLFSGRSVCAATIRECLESQRSTQCHCDQLLPRGDETSLSSLDAGVREGSVDINARKVVVHKFPESINDRELTLIMYWYSLASLDDKTTTTRLTWFLRHGFDINQPVDDRGMTLLHRACRRPLIDQDRLLCHYEYLKALLDNGARLDITDSEGNSPLHTIAGAACLPRILDTLLKSANGRPEIIDAVNHRGETPLSVALGSTSWLGKALLLLQAGASVQKSAASKISPLFSLIDHARAVERSIELLVRYGVDINEVHEGRVPSHELVRQFNLHSLHKPYSALMRLIEEGVPLNKVDIYGETVLTKVFALPDDEKSRVFLTRKDKAFVARDILAGWYKYNFPEHIERLEDAISDKCIEAYEADLSMLLETCADAFYLIDHTVDIIGKRLNQANMTKLRELLEKFRGHHRQDISLKPFVHCSPESFAYVPERMDEIALTMPVDSFVEYQLDLGNDPFGEDSGGKTIFTAIAEYDDTNDFLLKPSDVKITDWIVENKWDALQALLYKQHDLFQVVVDNKATVLSGLTEQNRNSLESLIASVPKDLQQDGITPRLSELHL